MLSVGDAPATQRRTSVARASKRVTDDRSWHGLPGKLETFAERARIVHIDVDPAEINKNKEAHIPMCTTTKDALVALNAALDARPLVDGQYGAWVTTLTETEGGVPYDVSCSGRRHHPPARHPGTWLMVPCGWFLP